MVLNSATPRACACGCALRCQTSDSLTPLPKGIAGGGLLYEKLTELVRCGPCPS